jgi:anti-sigma factor ChrR (cupin superfamily)
VTTPLEELAALDAAGALDEAEQREYRAKLSSASQEERAAIAQLYEMAAQLAAGSAASAPPDGARERLMKRIDGSRLYSLRANEGMWTRGPVAGTRVKLLSLDRLRNSATILMRVDPGAKYPPHHHSGGEDCYVISGEIIVAGQRLRAGDFHRAEPDSDHGVLSSETGAEILLVVSASDYM